MNAPTEQATLLQEQRPDLVTLAATTEQLIEEVVGHPITAPMGQPPQRQLPAVITPSDLLRIAIERNDGDLGRMERLMKMAQEWRAEQARVAFREDFAHFRGENIIVPKTKHVDRGRAGSFTQAEFDVACRMLSPALSKHGFSFRHDQKFTSRPWATDGVLNDVPWVIVTCLLEHRAGHVETLTLEGPPGDTDANSAVQNMQVTASVLKRHSLFAITGTATGGEDDEARLRRTGARDEAADEAAVAPLKLAGEAKSMEGTPALTAWWSSLTNAQRTLVMPHYGAMKKAARAADNDPPPGAPSDPPRMRPGQP